MKKIEKKQKKCRKTIEKHKTKCYRVNTINIDRRRSFMNKTKLLERVAKNEEPK